MKFLLKHPTTGKFYVQSNAQYPITGFYAATAAEATPVEDSAVPVVRATYAAPFESIPSYPVTTRTPAQLQKVRMAHLAAFKCRKHLKAAGYMSGDALYDQASALYHALCNEITS